MRSLSSARARALSLCRSICPSTYTCIHDADEYYKEDELAYAKKYMLDHDLDGTACKMRFYFKVWA